MRRCTGNTQWRRQEFQEFSMGGGGGGGVETLNRILTSMLSLMTRLRKAIHSFVSEERKLYHDFSMSPIPQKLITNDSIRGLAVPRAGDRPFVTSSIHGGTRSHLTYTVAHPGFGKRGSAGVAPSRQQIFAVFT